LTAAQELNQSAVELVGRLFVGQMSHAIERYQTHIAKILA
jgi:hypothetical protein